MIENFDTLAFIVLIEEIQSFKNIFNTFLIFNVYGVLVYMYICAPCVCLEPEKARRGSQIPLELEIPMVVIHCVGDNDQNLVLSRSSQCP